MLSSGAEKHAKTHVWCVWLVSSLSSVRYWRTKRDMSTCLKSVSTSSVKKSVQMSRRTSGEKMRSPSSSASMSSSGGCSGARKPTLRASSSRSPMAARCVRYSFAALFASASADVDESVPGISPGPVAVLAQPARASMAVRAVAVVAAMRFFNWGSPQS